MLRKLIVESILYWMNEYHIDGFRFDLAKLIDWKTTEEIIAQAKKINPNVIIIAEPWGGGYDPAGFSERGWAAWNDQIRNGIKGQNVNDGLGWIFGKWQGNNSFNRIKSYVRGTLVKDSLGLFQEESHSVNYLESHDDLTLGDFIRLCLKKVKEHQKIENLSEHNKLTEVELKMHKLAALFLFTSRGITMIHEGQEFARSKVIDVGDSTIDSHFGEIDHNTYNKDNKTNYLNFDFAKLNADLTDYYKGLIDLRKNANAFRRAKYDDVTFIDVANNDFVIAYTVQYENEKYFVVMNANPKEDLKIEFPEGVWSEVVNPKKVNLKGKIVKEKELKVCPTSGYVFRLEK
jgi:pullulanase/glycogen debranching enzyme